MCAKANQVAFALEHIFLSKLYIIISSSAVASLINLICLSFLLDSIESCDIQYRWNKFSRRYWLRKANLFRNALNHKKTEALDFKELQPSLNDTPDQNRTDNWPLGGVRYIRLTTGAEKNDSILSLFWNKNIRWLTAQHPTLLSFSNRF